MKIYKKQVRPMVVPPALQGFNCESYPLMPNDYWYNEEDELILRELWEKEAQKAEGGWGRLEIEERYTEIELPIPEVLDTNPGDIVIISVDPDEIPIDFASDWIDLFRKILPEEIGIVIKVKGIEISKE